VTPVGRGEPARAILRRLAGGPLTFGVMATIGLVGALFVLPGHTDVVLRTYVVVLGFLGLWFVSEVLAERYETREASAIEAVVRQRPVRPPPVPELEDLVGRLSFAQVSAADYEHRLRPLLRAIAAHRLAVGDGHIDIDADPELARQRLGPEVWAAIAEPLHTHAGRDAHGPTLARLGAIARTLERV
jgi:hypothetical protein